MTKLLFGILMIFATVGFAQAADVAAGEAQAATCKGCHGTDGIAKVPSYPNLAGQQEDYLAAQLKAYKTGTRQHPMMAPFAKPLSESDIANLAAYYASLSACPE